MEGSDKELLNGGTWDRNADMLKSLARPWPESTTAIPLKTAVHWLSPSPMQGGQFPQGLPGKAFVIPDGWFEKKKNHTQEPDY